MVNDIQAKLQSLVAERNAFQSEAEVVYFLVEVRKIIEKESLYSNYLALLFYCDWVVHPLIDRPKTIQYMSPVLEQMEQGNGYAGMSQMHKMNPLKSNLAHFLVDQKITDFTKNSVLWSEFFRNLRKVLVEQRIEIDPALGFKVASIEYIDNPEFEANYIPLDVTFQPDSKGITRSVQFNSIIE